ncbi:N-acetyllactosaminide beta-1,3-N-acetylglucosaminyltransferase 2-like [Thalassophryne amazonica]|uniref:N-acetyllactosaminide beta-1,3-N-acetylglucosaminyltransferase 2-like n=1 Tax=Thalassophryne amazonica TaxID=390379 RepID=UPI0014713DCF|nr:N-acetyllactosaminide beta-1,3-N-acetylglucosaminyltransferase 2-like [Thalassophryne amazonica]
MLSSVQVVKGSKMSTGGRKARAALVMMMVLNIFICIVMVLSWSLWQHRSSYQKIKIPSKKFWRTQTLSESFWNREQLRLDFIYSPVFTSELSNNSSVDLPEWMNSTAPVDPCEPVYRVSTQIWDYNTLPQRFQDFLLYMRCRTYPMLINQPNICHQKPFLLLAIKSLVPHFDRRQAIRETWGKAGVLANQTVTLVFLLGNAMPEDHFSDLTWLLAHEVELHKDILQWEYRDTFFNLTLKEVLFLEWFSQHCPQAQFILKGDDDVFINIPQIIDFLEGLPKSKAEELFVGDVISNAGPHRDQKLKYFIPESFFVGQYPPYAGGGGYLYSGKLALRLYNISQQVALYPIDDVYTGMCLRKMGLVPEKHTGFRTFDIEENFRSNPCVYRSLMLVHKRTPQEMLKIWTWIIHPELECQ